LVELAADVREILLRAFPGCQIEASERLAGGISARAVVVQLVLADQTRKRVVVRRPSRSTKEEALSAVRSEYAALCRCAGLGMPVPPACFLDLQAAAVVVEYVAGAPEFAPVELPDLLEQLAEQLARIHALPVTAVLEVLPRRRAQLEQSLRQPPAELDEGLGEPRLRAVLSELWPWQQEQPDVLLHGDYWPGNVVWQQGKLAAVLDWEETAIGDALADVAVSRLDILWAFGSAAMHAFTRCYAERAALDEPRLARWDLCVALRPMSDLPRWAACYAGAPICRPDITEQSMREGHRWFVEQALQRLGLQA
jgi:aminoglycoside phosphotransferase (APT) family kinase protein